MSEGSGTTPVGKGGSSGGSKMARMKKQMSLNAFVRKCSLKEFKARFARIRAHSDDDAAGVHSDDSALSVTVTRLSANRCNNEVSRTLSASPADAKCARKGTQDLPITSRDIGDPRRLSSKKRSQLSRVVHESMARRSSSLTNVDDIAKTPSLATEFLKMTSLHKRATRFTWKRMKANKNGRRLETVVEAVFERIVRKQPVMKDMFFKKSFVSALEGDRRETLTIRDHARCVIELIDHLMAEIEHHGCGSSGGVAEQPRRPTATSSQHSAAASSETVSGDLRCCPKSIGVAHRGLRPFGFRSSFWEEFGAALVDELFRLESIREVPGALGGWVAFTATLTDLLRAGFESSSSSSTTVLSSAKSSTASAGGAAHQQHQRQSRGGHKLSTASTTAVSRAPDAPKHEHRRDAYRRSRGGASFDSVASCMHSPPSPAYRVASMQPPPPSYDDRRPSRDSSAANICSRLPFRPAGGSHVMLWPVHPDDADEEPEPTFVGQCRSRGGDSWHNVGGTQLSSAQSSASFRSDRPAGAGSQTLLNSLPHGRHHSPSLMSSSRRTLTPMDSWSSGVNGYNDAAGEQQPYFATKMSRGVVSSSAIHDRWGSDDGGGGGGERRGAVMCTGDRLRWRSARDFVMSQDDEGARGGYQLEPAVATDGTMYRSRGPPPQQLSLDSGCRSPRQVPSMVVDQYYQ